MKAPNRMFHVSLLLLLASLITLNAQQVKNERIAMQVTETREILLDFTLRNYQVVEGVVKVQLSQDKKMVTVTALKQGSAQLTIYGTNGEMAIYIFVVEEDINKVLRQMKRALENLTTLEMKLEGDSIIINGTLSRVKDWTAYQKVISRYDKLVIDMVEFEPTPETYAKFVRQLEEAGYGVIKEKPEKLKPNELYVRFEDNVIHLDGVVIRNEDIANINKVIRSQPWLAPIKDNDDKEKGDTKGVPIRTSLEVLDANLDVSVVFVAITESEGKEIGNKGYDGKLIDFNISNWFTSDKQHGHGTSWGSGTFANMSIGINGALKFFASNGVSRFRSAGHVTFASNSQEGGHLKEGGTMYVRVSGENNGDLKEIECGLDLTVKGGLTSANDVKLKLKLNVKDAPVQTGSQGDYQQNQSIYEGEFPCKLDQTLVIGGANIINEAKENKGLIGLRNVPIFKWFVSSEGDPYSNKRLVILVSPRLLVDGEQAAPVIVPVQEETVPAIQKMDEAMNERKQKQEKKKRSLFRWFK